MHSKYQIYTHTHTLTFSCIYTSYTLCVRACVRLCVYRGINEERCARVGMNLRTFTWIWKLKQSRQELEIIKYETNVSYTHTHSDTNQTEWYVYVNIYISSCVFCDFVEECMRCACVWSVWIMLNQIRVSTFNFKLKLCTTRHALLSPGTRRRRF